MGATSPTKSGKNQRGSLAFGRNLIVFGGALLATGSWGVGHGLATLKWPRTAATIVDAELVRQTANSRRADGSVEQWNSFHVLYAYSVGGRDYVSGRVEPYDFGMQNSAGAEKMRARHPVGSAAQVAYDPNEPATAYLEPGPSSFSLALSGIGAAILLSGFWVRSLAKRGVGEMA